MPRPNQDSPDTNAFGKRVRTLRLAAGLTLQQVAEKTGFGTALLSRMETNPTYNPKLSTIKKLAEALGVKPADLIGE